jgi:hypothetical protein
MIGRRKRDGNHSPTQKIILYKIQREKISAGNNFIQDSEGKWIPSSGLQQNKDKRHQGIQLCPQEHP